MKVEAASIDRWATLSWCRSYRYALYRRWDARPALTWVMLNPSTADEHVDDATICRCQRRAQDGSYGGIIVLNLFALRATNPRELRQHRDPVGPENDGYLRKILSSPRVGGTAVCAWGCHGGYQGRDQKVLQLMREVGCRPVCLGRTKAGYPRHPLYVGYDQPLEPFGEEEFHALRFPGNG